jgi:protein ImuA
VRAPGSGVAGLRGAAALPAPAAVAPVEDLHPALWRAHQLARAGAAVLPSGFEQLDLQLPGGGWPTGALTELLLPQPGIGELRLLAPLLAALHRAQRSVLWFDPPATPGAWGLAALGLDMRQLVVVRRRDGASPAARRQLPAADILWALEQALKSGHVGAVLAWLPPRLPAEVLRRLQLAAQAHEGAAFLLRDTSLLQRPSPAPLRLALACAGPDRLRITLLKRRGPPALQPLLLDLAPVLSATAAARAAQPVQDVIAAAGLVMPGLPA